MNHFKAMSLATMCGVLTQPAALAEAFIKEPAPAVIMNKASYVSPETMAAFKAQLDEGKRLITMLTETAEQRYAQIVGMQNDVARESISPEERSKAENCEMFLRFMEVAAKETWQEKGLPEFVGMEMKSYWRMIVSARSAVTNLNSYMKQLFDVPRVFESNINFDALRELSESTTKKLGSINLH